MSDIYLKIAEVDGDVTDAKFVKHIAVQAILECMMLGGEVVEFLVRLQQQFLEVL